MIRCNSIISDGKKNYIIVKIKKDNRLGNIYGLVEWKDIITNLELKNEKIILHKINNKKESILEYYKNNGCDKIISEFELENYSIIFLW